MSCDHGGAQWVDAIISDSEHEWFRPDPLSAETDLHPDLPCRVLIGEEEHQPVIYLAVGRNNTPCYRQWASLDQTTWQPLPRDEALKRMRRIIQTALRRVRSEVVPELLHGGP